MKTIEMKYINKLKECDYNIAEAKDDIPVNRRKVVANERAKKYWLNKAGIFKEEYRREVLELTCWETDSVAMELISRGWEVV